MNDYEAERIKERQEQKTAIFAYLADKHPQVRRIEVGYTGFADEGYVDNINYFDGGDQRVKVKDAELAELLDRLSWLVTPDGFEINEGGQGTIRICLATQSIEVEHGQNHMETCYEEYEVKDGEPLPSQFE